MSDLADVADNTIGNVVGKICKLGRVRSTKTRIAAVEEDYSYRMKNVRVKNTMSDIYLQTIKGQSTIQPVTDVGNVAVPANTPDDRSLTTTQISTLGVESVSFHKMCRSCAMQMPESSDTKVKCRGCGLKQLLPKCATRIYGQDCCHVTIKRKAASGDTGPRHEGTSLLQVQEQRQRNKRSDTFQPVG